MPLLAYNEGGIDLSTLGGIHMKFLVLLLSFSFVANQAKADVPKLPDLNKWEELSERDKAQAGAFFLFYDLAKEGLIGPGSGVCMNYEPGDGGNGSTDKISIALDSAQFELAKANKMALGANADKIKNILGKIKNYLDSGCEPGQDCKSSRKVTVAGYADATRNRIDEDHHVEPITPGSPVPYSSLGNRQSKSISKNSGNPTVEESIKANTNLATRRAALYADLAKDFTDKVFVTAHPSPIGEYLRDGKSVPQSLGGEGLKPGDLDVNCQSRRKAVIDVEFNPHKVEADSGPGVMGLNISAGGKEFLTMSSMDASLQVVKQAVNKRTENEDKIIEGILNSQGISDPDIIRGCKNEGTKQFIRESLKRFDSKEIRAAVSAAEDNTKILAELKDAIKSKQAMNGLNAQLKKQYDEIKSDGFAGYATNSKLLSKDAFSSSMIDCFSAKSALKTEIQKNPTVRSQLCKSAKEFTKNNNLKIAYNPEEADHTGVHHIGCTGCGTGFNISKNPQTGKYEGYILDRYYGIDKNNRTTVMKDHRPFSSQEVMEYDALAKSLVADVDAASAKITGKDADSKEKLRQLRIIKSNLSDFGAGTEAKKTPEYIKNQLDLFPDKAKIEQVQKFLDRAYNKTLPEDLSYVRTLISKDYKPPGFNKDYYEKVLYPAVTAQKKLSEWGSKEGANSNNKMSFGGMKNPGYYVVPNCKCDDASGSVVDKIAGLKPTYLKDFPYSADVKVSDPDNTCIFLPPVPASCSYNPQEAPLTTGNKKAEPAKLKWISGSGAHMEKTALELANYLGEENKKFGEAPDCNAKDPVEKAEQLLSKASCQGAMALPTTEANDCRSKGSASKQ